MKTQKVKLSEIKRNPDNPRLIKDNKYKKLVTSIIEFPEMLEIRPIVVNDDMVVLGGNMRLKACQEAKLREVPIIKASKLTAEQQREFIVKDNVGFGEWDWDMLANEWDNSELNEWGLDVWQPEQEVDYSVLEDLDLEETLEGKESNVKRAVLIEFDPEHYDQAASLINEARKAGENVGLIVLNAFKNG